MRDKVTRLFSILSKKILSQKKNSFWDDYRHLIKQRALKSGKPKTCRIFWPLKIGQSRLRSSTHWINLPGIKCCGKKTTRNTWPCHNSRHVWSRFGTWMTFEKKCLSVLKERGERFELILIQIKYYDVLKLKIKFRWITLHGFEMGQL
jgi:hypothetical protein